MTKPASYHQFEKGESLMSKKMWLTPEEVIYQKKRKKGILYGSIMIATIILSTLVTFLANKIS
ncbi:hypothetical protein BAVI_03644 [Neobacillus vireti LMG 21834]|uniref:Uncharacterized protein n=1 Tax=Neobacillus vireti LMG 21834 TaxID=1131730 RepID=A0AB94IT50_9BACI|nr:hypothetical protein BAVI_03644 [Neobacillus vireti LMG 21834]KLT16479.1 hypothetical protein AA980_18595 [Neobacillus vireti]